MRPSRRLETMLGPKHAAVIATQDLHALSECFMYVCMQTLSVFIMSMHNE